MDGERYGSAGAYVLLVVAGPGPLFRPEDVVGMPANEFGPGYLPLFTGPDLIPEWVAFLTGDREVALETASLATQDVLKVLQQRGATHVAIDPRPDRPGRLVPVAAFIAGLDD